jgi:hypothetical protein
MPEITLYGIVSNIVQTGFRIHQVTEDKTKANVTLLSYVHLLTQLENVPTDLVNSGKFPVLTYKVVTPELIEIYEHSKVEKIQKGWVWNGKKSEIVTNKIGTFSIIEVENKFQYDYPIQEIPTIVVSAAAQTDNQDKDHEIDHLIDQMVNNIIDMKLEIGGNSYSDHKPNIESNKKLKTDPNLKKDMYSFESMFLPFFDEIKSTQSQEENEVLDEVPLPPAIRIGSRGQRAKRRYPYTNRFI